MPNPQALPTACRLNGNTLQHSNPKEVVFTVAHLVASGRRSFGRLGHKPRPSCSASTASVSVASWSAQTENKNRLRFRALLADGAWQVSYERVLKS